MTVALIARRRRSDPPTQPGRTVPAQLDRADFTRPDAAVARRRVHVGDVPDVCRRRPQGGGAGQRRRRRGRGRVQRQPRPPRPVRHRCRADPRDRRRRRRRPAAASSVRCRRPTSGPPWPRLATTTSRRPSLRPSHRPVAVRSMGVTDGSTRGVGRRRGDDVRRVAALARGPPVVLRLLHPAGHGRGAGRGAGGDRHRRRPAVGPGLAARRPDGDRVDARPPPAATRAVRRARRARRPGRRGDRARQRHGRRSGWHGVRRQLRVRSDGRGGDAERRRWRRSIRTAP